MKKTKSSRKIVQKITMSMTICQCYREDSLGYGDEGSQGSYHTPKLGEENMVLVPVMEPTLQPADQFLPPLDQENIPPRMIIPPPLNVLVEIPEEQELMVKECCRTTLAVRKQRAICSKGKVLKPYHCSACVQLSLVCKAVKYFQELCEQRQ